MLRHIHLRTRVKGGGPFWRGLAGSMQEYVHVKYVSVCMRLPAYADRERDWGGGEGGGGGGGGLIQTQKDKQR